MYPVINNILRSRSALCCALFIITATAYWGVHTNDFLGFDDASYVTENPHVRTGLKWDNIVWAFSASHASNWHPLTWISHMIDCELFGLDAGSHHLVNVVFHITNTLMLFLLLHRMTGALWRSAFAAALFALHPLHVESVAWIAERKDVLSTLLFLLTLWCYARFAEKPGPGRYTTVTVLFALGLMAKPMLVTLPFLLLLLDAWPLRRTGFQNRRDGAGLIIEKTPFFALSLVSCIVTFIVQQKGGAMGTEEEFPFFIRCANAIVAYGWYLVKMLWPANLAVLYPHSGMPPLWKIAGSAALLTLISCVAVQLRRRHPYLLTGWLWYLVTLVPVIGLVQVGVQAVADRYTYIPLIGPFIALSWGVSEIKVANRQTKTLVLAALCFSLSILMLLTRSQIKHWKNSISLYEHAIAVTKNNYTMHYNLGVQFMNKKNTDRAMKEFQAAIRSNPLYVRAYNNLGRLHITQGDRKAGVELFSKAIRIDNDFATAHFNLGLELRKTGKHKESLFHLKEALRIDPGYAKAHYNAGIIYEDLQLFANALLHYRKALSLQPDMHGAHTKVQEMETATHKIEKELSAVLDAARNNPESAFNNYRLGQLYLRAGRPAKAIEHYIDAVRISAEFASLILSRDPAPALDSEYADAIRLYSEILKTRPESSMARYRLACLYAEKNEIQNACRYLDRALIEGFRDCERILSDFSLFPIRSTACYNDIVQKCVAYAEDDS